MKKFIVIFIFLIRFVSCLEVDFSCPKEVNINEDFECKIEIPENYLSYDVKIEIVDNNTNLNKIWDGNSWQRANWYAKKLVNGEKTFVRVKIEKEFHGKAIGEIKIRDATNQKVVYEEEFKISRIKKEIDEEQEPNLEQNNFQESDENRENYEIKLNSKDIKTKKSANLLENKTLGLWILIPLSLFIGILYLRRQKRKNGKRKYEEDTFGSNN